MKESGRDIVNRHDIANTMNAYFCSVGKDLASEIEAVPNPMVTRKYNLNPHNKYFNFKEIGVQDIKEAMVKIKTSNRSGSDKISSYFLKLAMHFIESSLAFIFNTSLEISHFPDFLRVAHF